MEFVQIDQWKQIPWLRHGFSTRHGGTSIVYGGQTLNLGWTKDDDSDCVAENRRLFAEAVAGKPVEAVTVRQVHSDVTHILRGTEGPLATPEGRAVLEGDGLMTSHPGVLLGIQTADCVPVMVVDPERQVVAVFHAGWRGTVAGIVEKGVARMVAEFGSQPEQLLAAVGPSIGPTCYTVGEEVRQKFHESFPYAGALFTGSPGELRLDLWEANRRQLLSAGLLRDRISIVGECTGTQCTASGERRYFSHRMEHGFTGRMMNCIGIFPE